MRKASRIGITLVELILALGIFAVVCVAIYSSFSLGLSVWRKTQKAQNLFQDIRLALDKIAQDLENAVKYSEDEDFLNFVGEQKKLSFYAVVESYHRFPGHPELKKITYSLKQGNGEDANILQRLEQAFPDSQEESETQEPEEIVTKVNAFNFYYCYLDETIDPPSYKWTTAWNFAQEIPQGVKVELGPDAEEAPVFTKYVFIATGEKGQEEVE